MLIETSSVIQRIVEAMIPEFHPNFVLLSYGIAFIGVYVAFSGMIIKDLQGNIVPITFNPSISIFSLLVGFTFQVIGVYTACNDHFYAKSKSEILDFLVQRYNIEEILLSYNELHITYLLM